MAAGGRSGPHAENILRDVGIVAREAALEEVPTRQPRPQQQVKFYQVGSFVVGNRLLDPEQRSVQARMERSNTSPPATAPARAAARRSAPATPSTRRCGPPAAS